MTSSRLALAVAKRTLAAAPGDAAAWRRLGLAGAAEGRLEWATAPLMRAIVLDPSQAEDWYSLGLVLAALERWPAAASAYASAARIDPRSTRFAAARADALLKAGAADEAIAALDPAIGAAPENIDLRYARAAMRAQGGHFRDAIADLQVALCLQPGHAQALYTLSRCHASLAETGAVGTLLLRSLAIDPSSIESLANLGHVAQERMEPAIASRACRRALVLAPAIAEVFNNLAGAELLLGYVDAAVRHYRRAVANDPDWIAAHSNLLLALGYVDELPSATLFAEYRRWETRHARPHYARIRRHDNDPDRRRRLRLGYVSADFFHHPVATNTLGLIRHHDRRDVHVTCYAEVGRADDLTEHIKAVADAFVETQTLSDAELAERMRADRIDILVFLAGHTSRNRLTVAAWKPAPIQISIFDFTSTGLEVMDYWLTDPIIHPDGATEERFTETLLRLPMLFLHHPIRVAPPITSLPAPERGHVTFGSFNNPAKLGDRVIAAWAEILARVPASRLMLKYRQAYEAADLRARIRRGFAERGIAGDRIVFVGGNLDREHHLAMTAEMDIALDPFPFNGSTTTFEALWMGVPVVTLAGDRFLGRMSASSLVHAGLAEFVAPDIASYIALAAALASDPVRLAGLRATLRDRILASPICDGPRYARSVEAAYRQVWRRWCEGRRQPG